MNAVGIVMECNPFHEGHAYLLRKAREVTGAEYVVVALSGNFVQRGIPAVQDKSVRAQAVLTAGADLVLELPLPYAVGSADLFAEGAMRLFNRLPGITDLCFGSETGDLHALQERALLLAEEPEELQVAFRALLKEGLSYPAARAEVLGESETADANDRLATEYVKHLLRANSAIRPHAVLRIPAPSASSLREEMLAQAPHSALFANDFSDALLGVLSGKKDVSDILDVGTDLSNRIQANLPDFTDWDGFCRLLKTRNVTYGRVSRALLHILLGLTSAETSAALQAGGIGYARVLGFRKAAEPYVRKAASECAFPLLFRPAAECESIPAPFRSLWEKEVASSEMHTLFLKRKMSENKELNAALLSALPKSEYSRPLIKSE